MTKTPDILCIGSVLWDVIGRTPSHMRAGADLPGRISRLPGGVAMNIAVTLHRFGLTPALLTAIGRDPEGHELSRFALAGDWQEGQFVCTGALCAPGTCCNFCQSRYMLPCPDGVRSVALVADADLDLPTVMGDGVSPLSTTLGCVGSGGSDDTDCSADWACSPDVSTLCWVTGVVTSFDASVITMEVNAINLSVEP